MDYPNQTRLKIFARARTIERADDPAFVDSLADPTYTARVERAIVFEVEGFDWNCPQHITPRWTREELHELRAADGAGPSGP
jgi:hypothetical protein